MRPMDGYPDSWGAQRAAVIPHQGPVLYAVIVEGVAPALATGGDTVQAIEAGMKLIDFVVGGQTDSGKYFVQAIPVTASGVIATPNRIGQAATTYRLKWMVATTGVEAGAVDLSAEIVRLLVVGPK